MAKEAKRFHITPLPTDTEAGQVVTIREGEAPRVIYPQPYKISASLAVLAAWIENPGKLKTIDPDKATLTLNEEEMFARLDLDPRDEFAGSISGKAEISKDFNEMKLNVGPRGRFTRMELVQLLKMKRAFFTSMETHALIVSQLQALSVNTHGQIVNAFNDRGARTSSFTQTVGDNNAPLNFTIAMPIFKGGHARTFQVDVCFDVDGQNIHFWLESVEAEEVLRNYVREEMDIMSALYEKHGVVIIRQ